METLPVPSMEMEMESPTGQQKLQQEAVSEMGLSSAETKAEDFMTIDMPSDVSTTPEKVSIWGSSLAVYEVGSSSRTKSNSEYQTGTLTMEEVAVLALGDPHLPPSEKYPFLKPTVAINRATTLQAIPLWSLIPNGFGEYEPIYRSRSVPVSYTDVTMTEDHVRVLRVIPNRRSTERNAALLSPAIHNGGEDEDAITEAEAVCRICFEELGEERDTFRLECNCRGDLALVHRHCSQRWFNIRGTRTCEICRKRVRNVTVKITRRINTGILNQLQPPPMTYTDMIWHGLLLLFMVSMMAYLLAIELIKARRSGENTDEPYGSVSAAIVLSLFTSLAASAFGQWKDVWIYALAQYVVFTVFAEFFYDLLRLKPLPTLFLSTFFAIGIGRGAEPAYHAIKKWRAARMNQVNNNLQDAASQIDHQPTEETEESHHSDANLHVPNEETSVSHQSDANQHEPHEETDESHQADANHHESSEKTAESHHPVANSQE